MLIKEGAEVELWAQEGEGALHLAASDPHHIKGAAILIDNKVDVDGIRPSDYKTPLHIAIETSKLQH